MITDQIKAAIAALDSAKSDFANMINAIHADCPHEVWIEKKTAKVISWGNPHAASRICHDCRATINDQSIYDDWLGHNGYSFRKPEQVRLVMMPEQIGVTQDTFWSLRLADDPRPQFPNFAAVLAYKPEGTPNDQ